MKKIFIICFLAAHFISYTCLAMPTPDVKADGAILIEPTTGTILYNKNAYLKFYPASTTKLLTTLILLEEPYSNKIITKSAESILNIPSDSSHIGLTKGQQYTFLDGLHAILLASDNYVSYDMAVDNAKSISAFADKMNEKASSVGAFSSHFVNPHGYHDLNHYTTPYDLALIARAAFSNPTLYTIAGKPTYDFSILNSPQKLSLTHTSSLLDTTSPYYNPYVVASKTGYHTPAGRVLVAKAIYDNIELIGVVMKDTAPNQFIDMNELFQFGYQNFILNQDLGGYTYVQNVSYSPWAKPYVSYALEQGWITFSPKSFQDKLSKREFVGLLLNILPDENKALLSDFTQPSFSPSYAENLPLTKKEAASIIYELCIKLNVTSPNIYKVNETDTLNALSKKDQKAILFAISSGILSDSPNDSSWYTSLSYEKALALAYRFHLLYQTSIPYIFLAS